MEGPLRQQGAPPYFPISGWSSVARPLSQNLTEAGDVAVAWSR